MPVHLGVLLFNSCLKCAKHLSVCMLVVRKWKLCPWCCWLCSADGALGTCVCAREGLLSALYSICSFSFSKELPCRQTVPWVYVGVCVQLKWKIFPQFPLLLCVWFLPSVVLKVWWMVSVLLFMMLEINAVSPPGSKRKLKLWLKSAWATNRCRHNQHLNKGCFLYVPPSTNTAEFALNLESTPFFVLFFFCWRLSNTFFFPRWLKLSFIKNHWTCCVGSMRFKRKMWHRIAPVSLVSHFFLPNPRLIFKPYRSLLCLFLPHLLSIVACELGWKLIGFCKWSEACHAAVARTWSDVAL